MPPPNEEVTITTRTAVRRAPWLGGSLRWVPSVLPAFGDHLVVLSVLAMSRASTAGFDPGVLMFLTVLLALQVRPELTSRPLRPSVVDAAGPILRRALTAFGAVAAVTAITGIGRLEPVLLAGGVVSPALIGGRAISYAAARSFRSTHPARTLIVGAGEVARRVVAALGQRKEYGMDVIGVVDDSPKLSGDTLGTRVLGSVEDLPAITRSHHVENVIVAFSSQREEDTLQAVRTAAAEGVNVWVVPRLFELGGCPQTSEHLWGYPMFKVATPAAARPEWMLKWMLDKIGAALGLIVAAPFFGLIAAAVLFESGRPLFFRQERIGKDGRRFQLLKFRTMRVCDETTNRTEWAADECRVTGIGRVLRKTSLDELPQLLNVLKGDMSLVGPRPERPFFVDKFSTEFPSYEARHRMPVGVTGWSQIHGLRGDTSIEDRAALDNYYVDNWSLGQDLRIIVKTIPTLFGNQEVE